MTNTVQKIQVEAKSAFGIKDSISGKWLNPEKGSDLLAKFMVGMTYDVEMKSNKGKDGKTYINIVSIAKQHAIEPKAEAKAPVVASVPAPAAKAPVAKVADMPNKDERILVQGVLQALLQSPIITQVEAKNFVAFVDATVPSLVEIVRKHSAK